MTTSGSPSDDFPLVPSELIERLEEVFPAVDWGVNVELKDVLHYAGKRDLIAFLRLHHDDQHESAPAEES